MLGSPLGGGRGRRGEALVKGSYQTKNSYPTLNPETPKP